MLLRTPAEVARECRNTLAQFSPRSTADDTKPQYFYELLAWIAHPDGEPPHPHLADLHPVSFERGVQEQRFAFYWNIGRAAWCRGTQAFAGKFHPEAISPALIDQVALLRDPGIVRLIAYVATQRVGQASAGEWFRAHADYARPILEALAATGDPKETKAAEAGLALCNQAVTARKPSGIGRSKELAAIFAYLKSQLGSAKTKKQKISAIESAFETYLDACSAAGEPGDYFLHEFLEYDLEEWVDIATEIITKDRNRIGQLCYPG